MTKLRILMLHRQASAVGYYRTQLPARVLRAAGHEVVCPSETHDRLLRSEDDEDFVKAQAGRFDLIIVDRTVRFQDLKHFAALRHVNPGSRMIVDFDDDFANVPPWNPSWGSFQSGQQYREAGHAHLKLSELATVSTEPLRKAFERKAHAIRVCHNMIDPKDWTGLPTNRARGSDGHLRVLYGGASGHFGDLDVARAGIEAVIEKPPVPFRLICFGALPFWLHEASRKYPGRVVALPWVPFGDYPAAVAWGGFDVALAPLQDHPFNVAKSNIKWLEAAVQGIPFMCSNVGPYAEIPDGCAIRVENTPVQWSEGLRALLKDAALRQNLREESTEAVKQWTIDFAGRQWEDAAEEAMSRPRIESIEDTRLPHERIVRTPPEPEAPAQP